MFKEVSKACFFETKQQKTFGWLSRCCPDMRGGRILRFILLALPFLLPVAAHAHAFLDHAEPRVGSIVPTAPTEVVLTFTQAVEPAFSRLAVTDAAGAHEEAGAMHAGGDSRQLAVPLKALAAGTYTVTWHVTSGDTHKSQGKFVFTVGR